jgi:hypothetical protein
LHHPQLAQRIGDRGTGGEGGDTLDDAMLGDPRSAGLVTSPLPKDVQLEREILGA